MNNFDNIQFHGKFRDYQQRVLDNADKYLNDGRINIVAAPGSGKTVLGLELIRRVWGTMLEKGATTFWEFTPNDSVSRWPAPCHAWSAGCTYLLSAYVLGIRQTSPKWSSIVFAPRPCDLKYGKGVVVTPSGIIAAAATPARKSLRSATVTKCRC